MSTRPRTHRPTRTVSAIRTTVPARLAAARSVRPVAAGLAVALAAPLASLGLAAGPADAAPRRAQLTYECMAAAEGFEADARPYPFIVAAEFDMPDSVEPGQSLTLDGAFSVQMPEDLRALAADYFTTIQVVSDSLTVPVTVGGHTTTLGLTRLDSGPLPAATQPLVLSGAVGSDPFEIPADATGELHVGLPANGSATSVVDGSPVAFSAQALLSGGFVATFVGEYPYKVGCVAPEGADTTIATVPVAAPGGGPSAGPVALAAGAPAAGASVPTARAGAGGGTPPADRAASSPLAGEEAPGSGLQAPAAAAGAHTAEVAPGLVSQVSQARGGDVWVPGWLVIVVAGLLATASVIMAARAQQRLTAFRDELEG